MPTQIPGFGRCVLRFSNQAVYTYDDIFVINYCVNNWLISDHGIRRIIPSRFLGSFIVKDDADAEN